MKNNFARYLSKCTFNLIVLTLSLSSCSYKINPVSVSHRHIMSSYNTKDKILKSFGIPTTIKKNEQREEWYYDLSATKISDKKIYSDNFKENISIRLSGRLISGSLIPNSGLVTSGSSFYHAKKEERNLRVYIKFTLINDNPVGWQTKNLDLAQYETIKKEMVSSRLLMESGAFFLLLTAFFWIST